MPEMMSTDTPAQEMNDVEGPERNEANEGWQVPVEGLKVNGVAPSDGDDCKFEVMGRAVGSPTNGFITIVPKSVNGYDVPNSVSEDDTGDGSGPESNDDNDELASARSQYNEQSMGGSPGY